ncbi:MAG: response regulator transcription factor [Chloroflexota bacterium]
MATIVIVEDEPDVRRLIRASLASGRHTIFEGTDGDEGWALIQQHTPEVVVLDVDMPGRNGLELIQALKDDPTLASTGIVVVSAGGERWQVNAGLEFGADYYLLKPFAPRELAARVASLVAARAGPPSSAEGG